MPSSEPLALDTDRSRFGFKAKAFGLLWVKGTIPASTGTLTVGDGTFGGEGTAQAVDLSTGVGPRDAHLRHKHYLSAKEHPEIRVAATGIPTDAKELTAQLTARGETVDVPLTVESLEVTDTSVHLKASGWFDRVPLGMLPPAMGVSKMVELTVDLHTR